MFVHDFDPPERFVSGTVGQPGQRTFFLQARADRRVVSVSVEKEQVRALAERINEVIDDLAGHTVVGRVDDAPLETSIDEEFRAVAISLGWDGERGAVVIECHDGEVEIDDDGEVDRDGTGSLLRVVLTPEQARSFANRAERVVAAGRPPCPFCAQPLDPEGHVCPRANGYRRR